MNYFIRQIGEKDCGIAALKILLANIYKKRDFLFYPQANLNEALSLKDLMKIAKNEGVTLSAYRLTKKEEIKELKKKKCLVILKKDNILHIVYLKKVKRKGVVLNDPKRGVIFLRYSDFFAEWNGEVLEAIKVNGSSFKLKKERILPIGNEILLFSVQIFTYILFLSGLFFINSSVDFFIPLSLFICYVFSLILFNFLLNYFMKKVDISLFSNIYRSEGILKEKYMKITKLKTLLFSNPLQIISSISLIAFALAILGINSVLSLIFALSILFIQIVIKLISSNYLSHKRNYIENCEFNLFYAGNKDNALDNFKILNDEVYRYATLNNVKKYLITLIIIIACLFLSSFEEEISLNFVLFHIFSFYFISTNFDKILEYNKNKEELDYLKSTYYYYSKTC